jgi:hypothetical protein
LLTEPQCPGFPPAKDSCARAVDRCVRADTSGHGDGHLGYDFALTYALTG